MKRNNIVSIFAHPDDEAFGPAGTIAKWAGENDVYIICVTDGSNPNGGIKELKNIRNKELEESAKILGVKKVFFLGYCDGELYNNIYHKVARDVEKILNKLKPSRIMTFEYRGVSGHIDHMFVSMVSSYLYEKLNFIKEIYYYAEYSLISKMMRNYFIYFPEGFDKSKVDHVENVSKYYSLKEKAIRTHVSQKKDGDLILKKLKFLPQEELFFKKHKSTLSKINNKVKLTGQISKLLFKKVISQ